MIELQFILDILMNSMKNLKSQFKTNEILLMKHFRFMTNL